MDSLIVCKIFIYFLHLISYHLTKSADNRVFIHKVIRFLVPWQVWLSKNVWLFLTFYVTIIITKLQQLLRSTRKLLVLYFNWSFESKLLRTRITVCIYIDLYLSAYSASPLFDTYKSYRNSLQTIYFFLPEIYAWRCAES